jgi:glycosyltransferase involved in cell wall biosynthesis
MSSVSLDVSVVITNYNKGELLLRAIDSVEGQLSNNDEIILIDDCSTNFVDKSIIGEFYKKKSNILLVERLAINLGVSSAKNRGVRLAKNDIVVLLDADDTLPEGAVNIIKHGFADTGADIIFGDYAHSFDNAESVKISCADLAVGGVLDPVKLAFNWKILGTAPFRKSTCFNNTCFDELYDRTDDVDFQRRQVLAGRKICYVDSIIYNWSQEKEGNNYKIPSKDIFLSHSRSFDFFLRYLSRKEFFLFFLKYQFRLCRILYFKILGRY